jgi:hypothetical protein
MEENTTTDINEKLKESASSFHGNEQSVGQKHGRRLLIGLWSRTHFA